MADQTITRAHLADAVYREIGLSKFEAAALLDAVLDEIADELACGGEVKISGFASFSTRDKVARVGRNPKTGEAAPIQSRRVAVFRASQILKARVKDALGYGGGVKPSRMAASGD